MPKRVRSLSVGVSASIGYPRTLTGFPSSQEKLALGISSAAVVVAGNEIIGTMTSGTRIELSRLGTKRLENVGVLDKRGELETRFNNPTSETIVSTRDVVASVIDSFAGATADQDMLSIVYSDFLRALLDGNPLYIGSEAKYQEAVAYFEGRIATENPQGMFYLIARYALDAVKAARSRYIETMQYKTEVDDMRCRYDKALAKIEKLARKLAQDTGYVEDAFGGKLGIVVNKPKPIIYAQAILNPTMAWYIYLNGNACMDPALYAGVEDYVKQFGPKREITAALNKLLDERFRTFDNDIANLDLTSSEATSSGDKQTTSCSANADSSCISSSDGASSSCPDQDSLVVGSMVTFGSSADDAPSVFVLDGELEVKKKFVGKKNTRKKCKGKHNKTCKLDRSPDYKSGTALPVGPYGEWGMVLDGGLAIKTTPGFRNKVGTRRRYIETSGSKCTRKVYRAPAGTIYMGALYLEGDLSVTKKNVGQ